MMAPILYHLMIPRPRAPRPDAVVQEAEALRAHFGGELVYLNPARRPGSLYPERLYGLHRLPALRRRESAFRLHHVYNAHLLLFPYLRWLRRPIIYSVAAGLRPSRRIERARLSALAAIVVSSERDRRSLAESGLDNVHVIRSGIDLSRFTPAPTPEAPGFRLLAGSAPWTEDQFRSKGVTALLAAAEVRWDLRPVFLWRGLLFERMREEIAQRHLEKRVRVINEWVNVNEVLAGVHAAVVLASDATLVKAFPHSLLEALAVGRPVLVSRALPMAEYVERTGCGQVVETVSGAGVLEALERLESNYEAHREAALRVGRRDFSRQALVRAYGQLYESVSEQSLWHHPRCL